MSLEIGYDEGIEITTIGSMSRTYLPGVYMLDVRYKDTVILSMTSDAGWTKEGLEEITWALETALEAWDHP